MGGGYVASLLHVNKPKKTGGRSAQARRSQKLLVEHKKYTYQVYKNLVVQHQEKETIFLISNVVQERFLNVHIQ